MDIYRNHHCVYTKLEDIKGMKHILYIDDFTHELCVDVAKDGKIISQYRASDVEELKMILENE